MKDLRLALLVLVAVGACSSNALAVNPNPLESAYWRFEEGTAFQPVTPRNADVVVDSLNDNNMRAFMNETVDAAPTYTTEVAPTPLKSGLQNNLALDFLPNQDLFSQEQDINNGFIATGGGFTVEAAFKPNNVSAFQGIVAKEGRPAEGNGLGFIENLPTFVLKLRDNGLLQVELWDGGEATSAADNPQVSSTASLMTGQWYYAAVVNDGSTLSLWLDRNDSQGYQLQGSTPLEGGALYQGDDPQNPDWDRPWTIGRAEFGGGPADFFDGIIDEVRITNAALAPSQFLFAPPSEELEGDYNGNEVVDAADYTVWRDTLGSTTMLDADGDGNGTVGPEDYTIWKTNFGNTPGAGSLAAASVPEPSTILLCLFMIAGAAGLRQPR